MCVLVIGHRGFPSKYPENSIASFLAALLYGADGVEFDVWLSRDGVPIVIHDRKTGRVASEDLDVKNTDHSVLKKIYLGKGQTIPTLEEVMESLPRDKVFIIEIKDREAVNEVYGIIRSYNLLDNTVFVSFDFETLARIRELDKNVKIGFNIGNVDAAMEALKLKEKLNAYSVALPITAPLIIGWEKVVNYLEQARKIGFKIAFWSPLGSKPEETIELYKKLKGKYDYAIVNDIVNEGNEIKKM